jgi:hypothetical protein
VTTPRDLLAAWRGATSPALRGRLLWLAASATLLAAMWSSTKGEFAEAPPPADGPPPD